MTTGAEIATTIADVEGRFELRTSAREYAVAAVSERAYAYAEHVTPGHGAISVAMTTDCARVRGMVTGSVPPGTIVELARASDNLADRFRADVSARGEFVVCLPPGSYAASALGAAVSFPVDFTTPRDRSVHLSAHARSAIEAEPPGPLALTSTGFRDFERSFLAGPRVLGLGESNHGTGDYYRLRGSLSRALARDGRLRFVMLEADAIGMMAIDDYVLGEPLDLRAAIAALEAWPTDTEDFLSFIESVRADNAGLPPAAQVHLMGFDLQNTALPCRMLSERAGPLAIPGVELGLLARLAPRRARALTSFTPEENRAIDALLARLVDPPTTDPVSAAPVRVALAARSLQLQLDYLRRGRPRGYRDEAMARFVEFALRFTAGQQVSLWAHDGHVAREHDGTTRSMGEHLADALGDDYAAIAFQSLEGDARAWDATGSIGVIPHHLPPPPAFHVEAVLMRAAHLPDVGWFRFDHQPPALREWLRLPRYTREFGASYAPLQSRTLRNFSAAFTAIVVARHTSATVPTATGVRRASP
jgi:erythromycin esterase